MTSQGRFPIACAGNARVGKDTLFVCLKTILKEYNIEVEQFSLANILKSDLNKFLIEKTGISSYTIDEKEKEIIRPLFVEYGQIQRSLSQGKYWSSLLTTPIKNSLESGLLPIITDVRYHVYPEDEYFWLKNVLGGELVYIKRTLENGKEIPPPNKMEAENNPKLDKLADYHLNWPTTSDENVRLDYTRVQLAPLINKIINA